MRYEFLADRAQALPTIAGWYFDQWGYLNADATLAGTVTKLQDYLHSDRMPFVLLGLVGDDICAVAQLKFYEMGDMYPDREHWIGGVFVPAPFRGNGYGEQIAGEIAARAPAYGVEILNLQTERLDGGLYARLGWQPVERAHNHGLEVLVMERRLGG